MKKILISIFLFLLSSQSGICSLSDKEINVYNLKENNMYILKTDFSVKNINISDKNIINIIPVTTISNDKKQLFIETNKTGVCDVIITAGETVYKLRFISGQIFQDNKPELTEIDIPSDILPSASVQSMTPSKFLSNNSNIKTGQTTNAGYNSK